MVCTMGPDPLFCYVYSPAIHTRQERGWRLFAAQTAERNREDNGGFNVAIYSDGTVVHCVYDRSKKYAIQQNVFALPPEVANHVVELLRTSNWWIQQLPMHIRAAHDHPRYSCLFGFAGHQMYTCDELDRMANLPESSELGVFARKLSSLMDSMVWMLNAYGLTLSRSYFDWDWGWIQPMPPEMAEAKLQQINAWQQMAPMQQAQ